MVETGSRAVGRESVADSIAGEIGGSGVAGLGVPVATAEASILLSLLLGPSSSSGVGGISLIT